MIRGRCPFVQRTYTVLKVFPIDPGLKIRGPPAAYQYVTDLACFFDGEVGGHVEELAGKHLPGFFPPLMGTYGSCRM